jgi:hypothetical protein
MIDRAFLKGLSDPVKQHNRDALRHLADRKRPDAGNRHQKVFIKNVSASDSLHGADQNLPADKQVGREKNDKPRNPAPGSGPRKLKNHTNGKYNGAPDQKPPRKDAALSCLTTSIRLCPAHLVIAASIIAMRIFTLVLATVLRHQFDIQFFCAMFTAASRFVFR